MNDVPVCRVEELPVGAHRVVRVGRREVGVFNIGGELHAIPNLCPHQRGPLCEGSVSGAFHVPTGQCLALPDVRLRKFDVRAVDGEVRVVV